MFQAKGKAKDNWKQSEVSKAIPMGKLLPFVERHARCAFLTGSLCSIPCLFTNFSTGKYHVMVFSIVMERFWVTYVFAWFLPMQMIWLVAYSTYFQDPEGNAGRDGISITAFLSMIFYQVEIKSHLPKLTYLTWVEIYLFVYCILAGVCVVEFVWVAANFRDNSAYDMILHGADEHDGETEALVGKMKKQLASGETHEDTEEKVGAALMDKRFRVWIPVITIVFNIVSFSILLSERAKPKEFLFNEGAF
jgi:hypothetical protein